MQNSQKQYLLEVTRIRSRNVFTFQICAAIIFVVNLSFGSKSLQDSNDLSYDYIFAVCRLGCMEGIE